MLEYLAHEIVERHGTAKGNIYYPVVDDESKFEDQQRRKLPGVQENRADIVAFIRTHQPFNGAAWMSDLVRYTNEMKHHRLVPQTRTEMVMHSVRTASGSVSWNPSSVQFGSGVYINGAPVNPATQMPQGVPVRTTVYVGWTFPGEAVDVLSMLTAIQDGLRAWVPRLASRI